MRRTAPYGSWASPLSAEGAVAAGIESSIEISSAWFCQSQMRCSVYGVLKYR